MEQKFKIPKKLPVRLLTKIRRRGDFKEYSKTRKHNMSYFIYDEVLFLTFKGTRIGINLELVDEIREEQNRQLTDDIKKMDGEERKRRKRK